MNRLYEAQKSPIQNLIDGYQAFGNGRSFLNKPQDDSSLARFCGLIDLTNISRVGFRGVEAAEYLTAQGFLLPEAPNTLVTQSDGSVVARLSATEYMLLGGVADLGERLAQLENSWVMSEQLNYLLPRQDSHALFQITGAYLAPIMAKLCAVDLSQETFVTGQVVQSSVARVNAIIMNVSDEQTSKFNILCDRTMALYLWDVLVDAMQEFDGEVLGINALI